MSNFVSHQEQIYSNTNEIIYNEMKVIENMLCKTVTDAYKYLIEVLCNETVN